MSVTIALQPEIEAHFMEEAVRLGIPLEQLVTQRLLDQ